MAHAIGLHPQRGIERGGRHVLEIIGAIGTGGAVLVGGADLLEGLEKLALVILATLKHQMLEQMRETGLSRLFVLGADVIPHVDGHDRRLVILVHHHPQAVVEGKALRSEEHTSELQSLMRTSYAVFCLKKNNI